MKIYRHLLLIISLVTISFFSINNVSAETINFDFETKNYNSLINNWCNTEEVENFYIEQYKNDYKYYLYSNKMTGYVTKGIILWNDSDVRFGFDSRYYNGKPAMWFYLTNPNRAQLKFVTLTCDTSGLITSSNEMELNDKNDSVQFWDYLGRSALEDLNTDYNISFSFKTNVPILFYDKDTYYQYNSNIKQEYNTFTYKGVDYSPGDYVFNSDFTPYTGDVLPIISITKESEEITTIDKIDYISAVNMKIETNVIDDTKYICMLSTDMQDWDKYICSETYNYRMEKNGTLYVKIVDKVSEKLITSATYTVSSIQSLPYKGDKVNIYFQKITEKVDPTLYNQCTISQSLVNYRVCETVSISFDVINYNNYIYEMSLDGGNTWEDVSTRIYNNFYLERIFENKVIYIRVLNRSDYSYNNSSTYQITTIESASEYGQKVLFGSKYYTQRPDVDVTALFLNYDSTTYNYYYSLYNTSDSFIDITDSISCTNNLCTFNTRIYVKGTMYVRIEDKSGNLIYTATYTVDYYNWLKANNPFDEGDFFESFFNSFDYFLNPIKEIFNSVSIFFDSLPIELKYTFYVSFVIIIVLFLIKFVL